MTGIGGPSVNSFPCGCVWHCIELRRNGRTRLRCSLDRKPIEFRKIIGVGSRTAQQLYGSTDGCMGFESFLQLAVFNHRMTADVNA